VTGHHTGPGVSEFFGDAITCYDWAYVIAPGRVGTLFTLLGGQAGDDVLDLLPPITTSTAGRLTTCCEALRLPRRSATGIANTHQPLISAVARLSAARASLSCPLQATARVMERTLQVKASRGPDHLSSDGGSGRRAN
jgi:hypothetical protein